MNAGPHPNSSAAVSATETAQGGALSSDVGSQSRSDPVEWLDEYGDYLFNLAVGQVRSQHVAEDLVQETLLAAFSAWKSFEGKSSVRTWLTGILRNKIADHIRKRCRERRAFDEHASADAIQELFNDHGFWKTGVSKKSELPRTSADRAEFWKAFHECSSQLSPTIADAFCLREINGIGVREVCEILNVTQTNLSTMLYRARMLLRKCLETNWFLRGEDQTATSTTSPTTNSELPS